MPQVQNIVFLKQYSVSMSFTVFLWDVEFFNLVTVIKIVFSGFIIKLLLYGRLYAPSSTPALRLKSDIIVKVSKPNQHLYHFFSIG